jgi:saccharopine dehydrogenase-like NADP-dependent oxidoreductase
MRVLLVGVGAVGEAIGVVARDKPWLEQMVLADYNLKRAKEVQKKLGRRKKFPAEFVDAGQKRQVMELARKYGVDLIMNACDPSLNVPIFEAAYSYGCTYMDMAMSLSSPHPEKPFEQCGVKLGDYQFERASKWVKKGLLALVGMGMDPGLVDVFAKYAEMHLFDEIEEIGIRDGANLEVLGYEFAPTFSVWTAIDECLSPPVVWEKDRGWFTTEIFSEPEVFEFPEGIGPMECVNVEHEEVLLIPRWIKCQRVTFKYGLSDQFIGVLKMLHMLGLDNEEKIKVKDVWVAPLDVVVACLPDPAHLGDRMTGKTCVGTWIKGIKDGQPRQVYLYQVADNETCMSKYGVQAVAWQTAVNPVIAMELLEKGLWKGKGVLGPEAFDPDPFVALMDEYEFPMGMVEMSRPT